MSFRLSRFEREIREIVSQYFITDMRDELPLLTSVTRVSVSADLRQAHVHVHTEGAPEKEVFQALEAHRISVQKQIARRIGARVTPRISFEKDPSYEKVLKVEKLLRELHEPS